MPLERPQQLPFDQYVRHREVVEAVRAVRELDPELHVLDVGGAHGVLGNFLPEYRITIVDPALESDGEDGLRASGLALPFADGAAPVVASIDTLEHIPTADRPAFLAELVRVARHLVVLTVPVASSETTAAETAISGLRQDNEPVQRFLEEHQNFGLPSSEEVRSLLAASGAPVELRPSTGHAALVFHQALEELCAHIPEGERLLGPLQALSTEFSSVAPPTGQPGYRLVAVVKKHPALARTSLLAKPIVFRPLPATELTALASQLSTAMADLRGHYSHQQQRIVVLEQNKQDLQDEVARLREYTAKLQAELAQAKQGYALLEEQAREQAAQMQAEMDRQGGEFTQLEQQFQTLEQHYRELTAQYQSLDQQQQALTSQYQDLERHALHTADELKATQGQSEHFRLLAEQKIEEIRQLGEVLEAYRAQVAEYQQTVGYRLRKAIGKGPPDLPG